MRILIAIIAVFALLSSAHSQEDNALAGCAAISSDTVRLYCYDVLSGKIESIPDEGGSAVEKPPIINTRNNWYLEEKVSPIDDSAVVFLSTLELGPSRGTKDASVGFLLVLACRENRTNMWIHFGNDYKFDKKTRRITYRVDNKSARNKDLFESNNGEALGLWSGNSAIPFIKSMFRAERLFIRATPKSSNFVEAEFDISGLEREVEPLRRACHW